MATKKKTTKKTPGKPADGILAKAARSIGTVAGKLAAGFGMAEPKAGGRTRQRKATPAKAVSGEKSTRLRSKKPVRKVAKKTGEA